MRITCATRLLLVWGLATASCHPVAEETTRGDDGWTRVIIHSALDAPVGLTVSTGFALTGGRANPVGGLPTVERVDGFPVERRCRRNAMCTIAVRNRLAAVVFAFDPVVEVVLSPEGDRGLGSVHYREPGSVSAVLGEVHEQSTALESACSDHRLERLQRVARAQAPERALRELIANKERGVVGRAAGLALVQGQCTQAAENREIARGLLDTLDPTAPELTLWTDALRTIGSLAGDSRRARELVDAVAELHPVPEVGARLLFLRLYDLDEHADPRAREELAERLASPRFAQTGYARLAKTRARVRDAIALSPGDSLPRLSFRGVAGDPILPDEGGGQPQLLYFSASWCKACIGALPRVRRLSKVHPELRVVYVLFDGPNDAREFRTQRTPVPGELAWTSEDDRRALRSSIFKSVSLPSFVLADAAGTVLATSDETELAALDEVLLSAEAAEAGAP